MIAIAHRGAMGHAPENTLKSIEVALRLGARHVEIDIYYVDSKLLVFHDDRLERTTNGSGYIKDHSFKSLRLLDAGDGEKIPTLEEVLELIDGRAALNIELKGINTAKPLAELLSKVCNTTKVWKNESFLVSSFNHKELYQFYKLKSEIKVGILHYAMHLDDFSFIKKINPYSVHPSLDFIDKDYVTKAHLEGYKVFCYTANYKEDIEKLENFGVDGIFTNYPERVITEIEKYQSTKLAIW